MRSLYRCTLAVLAWVAEAAKSFCLVVSYLQYGQGRGPKVVGALSMSGRAPQARYADSSFSKRTTVCSRNVHSLTVLDMYQPGAPPCTSQ